MKLKLTILSFIVSVNCFAQTTGYVLSNADGTIRIPDSSITTNKIAGLLAMLAAKQNTLTSGTTIKTINGTTLLGSGDLVVGGGATAWGQITGTLSNQSDLQTALNAKMFNTATVGVANCPTASGTQTITHNLGRTPTVIEIYGVGRFTSNAAATPTPFSSGTWTSVSGNSCVYMTSAGTVTQDGLSSAVFSVFIATSSGNTMSGVIGNVGAVSFDIVWTEVGTAVALPFRWKAQ